MDRTLQICKDEYLRAVHERQVEWMDGRGVTQAEQSRNLTIRKRNLGTPLRDVYSTVLTDVLYRVRQAFIRKSQDAKSHAPDFFKYPSVAGHGRAGRTPAAVKDRGYTHGATIPRNAG